MNSQNEGFSPKGNSAPQNFKKNNLSNKNKPFKKKKFKTNIDEAIKAFLSFKDMSKTGELDRQIKNNKKKTTKIKKIKNYQKPEKDNRNFGHFVLKPNIPAQKVFPYLTPMQSFRKHMPYPKEHHKKQISKGTLRIIPFGGMEQVGLNCIGFEYGNEVVLVDMGIQFPDEHMLGVSGRIPDLSYLADKNVIAVLITHGHIDHIGAIPFLMPMLGQQIPVYAGKMALELMKMRQEDYKKTLNLKEFSRNKLIQIGNFFYCEPFTVDHSIPDSMGLRIHTPVGKFIHTGDWKFDHDPRDNVASTDHQQLKRFGREGVRALLSDSTNAHLTGSSLAEKIVIEPIEAIFEKASGRIITGTFSSIVDRLQIIINTAEKFNRKVALLGRGMLNYFNIAKKLGYIKNKKGTIIDVSQIDKFPDKNICICCTGAQGERYAALMRIATGESKDTEFKVNDTVILSSSVIPGNERKVQELMDILAEQNVAVHHYRQSNVHAGGHAREEDIKTMLKEINPKVFVPIYGNRFMIHSNYEIARKIGYAKEKIFVARNGQIMEFTKDSQKITDYFVSHNMVSLDGFLVGFTMEKEFSERFQMMKEGLLIINIIPQRKLPKVHLISHGFLNFSLLPELKEEIVEKVEEAYLQGKKEKYSRDESNSCIRKRVQNFIWTKIGKQPVVIIAS